MKKIISALSLVLCFIASASTRNFTNTWDVSQTPIMQNKIWFLQAESVSYELRCTYGGAVFKLTNANTVVLWELSAANSYSNVYIASTGTITSATGGVVRLTLSPEQSNLDGGTYNGFVVANVMSGTSVVNRIVLERQLVIVGWSPYGLEVANAQASTPFYTKTNSDFNYAPRAGFTNLDYFVTNYVVSATNSISASISNINVSITSLSTSTNSLRLATNALNSATNALNLATNSLHSSVTNLNLTTNALRSATNLLNAATNALNSSVTNINLDISVLRTMTNSLKTATNTLNTATNALNTYIIALNTATNSLKNATNALRNATNYLKLATNALNTAVIDLQNDVGILETTTSDLTTSVSGINDSITELNSATNNLNDWTNNFTTVGLETDFTFMSDGITTGRVWFGLGGVLTNVDLDISD